MTNSKGSISQFMEHYYLHFNAAAVVDAAKGAGATGATIIPARGTGIHEAKTFFGLTLEAQTDIVMLLVEEHMVPNILDAIEIDSNVFPFLIGKAELKSVKKEVGYLVRLFLKRRSHSCSKIAQLQRCAWIWI